MSYLESIRQFLQGTQLYGVAEWAYDTMLVLYLATEPTSSISLSGVSTEFHPTTTEEWKSVNYRVKREFPVLRDILGSVRSDDVFYDVGAHIGIYSCLVGRKLSDGQVVAFEPFPPNRSQLQRHININQIPASVQTYALADSNGSAKFKVQITSQRGAEQGSIDDTYPDSTQTVETISVNTARGDKLVSSGLIDPPTVIKIDIEGAAPDAIKGLRQCLSAEKCRRIYVEPHNNGEEICELLRKLEFEVRSISLDGHGEPTIVGISR